MSYLFPGTVEDSLTFSYEDDLPSALQFFDPQVLDIPERPLLFYGIDERMPELVNNWQNAGEIGSYRNVDAFYDFQEVPDEAENHPVKIVPYLSLNRAYWKGFRRDFADTFTAPLRWKGLDWAKLGMLTALTTIVYANDDGIMSNVQKGSTRGTVRIAEWVEKFGNPLVIVPGLLLSYGYSKAFKRPKLRETALLAFKSALISTAVVHVIKFSVHRHRPTAGPSSTLWDGPSFSNSNLSFPSGHATAVFSIASVVAAQYKKPLVGILSYTVAVLTAVSRVHDRKHWASDVLFGAAIGYFTGRGIMTRKRKRDRTLNGKAKRVKIVPVIGFGNIGLGAYYIF